MCKLRVHFIFYKQKCTISEIVYIVIQLKNKRENSTIVVTIPVKSNVFRYSI